MQAASADPAELQKKAEALYKSIMSMTANGSSGQPVDAAALQATIKQLEAAHSTLQDGGSAPPVPPSAPAGPAEDHASVSSGDGYSDDEFEDSVSPSPRHRQHQPPENDVQEGERSSSPLTPSPGPETPLFQRREAPPVVADQDFDRAAHQSHRSAAQLRHRDEDMEYFEEATASRNTVGVAHTTIRRERAYKKKRLKSKKSFKRPKARVAKKMRRYGPNLDIYRAKGPRLSTVRGDRYCPRCARQVIGGDLQAHNKR